MALFIAPPATCRDRILSNTKSFTLALKHQPFARDQSNVQKTPVSFKSLPRNTLDQRVLLEQSIPNGREIIPLAHRVRAQARKVVRSLLRHRENKRLDFWRTFDLDQCHSTRCTQSFTKWVQGPRGFRATKNEDGDDYFRQQAAMYWQLAEKTKDTFIKQELLDVAAVCEEVANNIEEVCRPSRRKSGSYLDQSWSR
jgi:hypothetical protein